MTNVAVGNPSEDRRSLVYEIALTNARLHLMGDKKHEVAELIARSVLAQYDRAKPRHSVRAWARRHTVLMAAWLNRGLVAATESDGQLVVLNPAMPPLAEPVSLTDKLLPLRRQTKKLDSLLVSLDIVVELELSDFRLEFARKVVSGKRIVEAGAELGLTAPEAKLQWLDLNLEIARRLILQCSLDPLLIYADLFLDLRMASRTLGQLLLLKRTSATGTLQPIV